MRGGTAALLVVFGSCATAAVDPPQDWRELLEPKHVTFGAYAAAVRGAFQECDPAIQVAIAGQDQLTVVWPSGGTTTIHSCCYSQPRDPARRVQLVWRLMTHTVTQCTSEDIELPDAIEIVEPF